VGPSNVEDANAQVGENPNGGEGKPGTRGEKRKEREKITVRDGLKNDQSTGVPANGARSATCRRKEEAGRKRRGVPINKITKMKRSFDWSRQNRKDEECRGGGGKKAK